MSAKMHAPERPSSQVPTSIEQVAPVQLTKTLVHLNEQSKPVELQPCSKYSKPRQQQLASKHIVNGSILSVGSTRVDCFFKGGPQGKLEILKLVSVQLLENHEMLRKPEHVKNRERGPRAGRAKQPDLPEAARQRPPGDMVWGIREHV